MTNTATTLSQSDGVSLLGLSITRYGTVRPPSLRLVIKSSFSRFPPFLISSFDTNRKSCKISLVLYMVIRDLGAAEITMIGVRETLFPPLLGVLGEAMEGGMLLTTPLELFELG